MALMRVGGRDTLNISSETPLPHAYQSQSVANDTPSSVNSNKSLSVFPCKRIADFPSPIFNIKRLRYDATPKKSNSSSGTPTFVMGGNVEPDCNEHYSFSFSPAFSRRSFQPCTIENSTVSFHSPMKGYRFFKNYVSKNPVENVRPSAILNPNKAVLVIDSDGKILSSNEMTFILFGELLDNSTIYDFIPNNSERKVIKKNLHKSNKEVGNVVDVSKGSINSSFQDASLPLTFEEDLVEDIGKVVFCGQVITIDAHDIGRLEVSLWMQKVVTGHGEEPRWVIILEPIKISESSVDVNGDGLVLKYDDNFKKFFSFERNAVLGNVNIFDHISSLKLPGKEYSSKKLRLKCSGRTLDGVNFPLSVSIKLSKSEKDNQDVNSTVYSIKLKMFCHIGGLVILDANASIVDYNRSFIRLLFGYGANELKNCDISDLLPSFNQTSPSNFNDDFFAHHNKDDSKNVTSTINSMNDSSILIIDEYNHKENYAPIKFPVEFRDERKRLQLSLLNSEGSSVSSPNKALIISDSQFTLSSANATSLNANQKCTSSNLNSFSNNALSGDSDVIVVNCESSIQNSVPVMKDITNSFKSLNISEQIALTESPDVSLMPLNMDMVTSTPAMHKYRSPPQIQEGSYMGIAKHKDGSEINVLYQIRQVVAEGKLQFCMWILWEPDACEESLAETSRLELAYQVNKTDEAHSGLENAHSRKSSDRQPTSTSESSKSFNQCSKSFQSQMRYERYGSPSLKSSITSLSSDSLANESSISVYDEDSSFLKSPEPKLQYLSKSCIESEDDTISLTCTEGSSEDEYSINNEDNIKEQVKRRSFSDSAIIRMKRRDSNDVDESVCLVPDEVLGYGDFINHYTIIRNMGKGAYGYVKMCYRHSDGLLVSTKFITKSQVHRDGWAKDDSGKKVPLEIIFLMTLDHPNIVKAYEFFENDKYFQLVTEKWGAGMDLFEFIERNPAIDEPLASYIFRQIVCALVYLRSNNILHQDIKDENIIINHKFHVKLIDFGSAAFFYPNTLFSNFTGTVEYCSPEVIKGGSHSGLELEVWSLGITLYTLMFGENPFSSLSQVANHDLVIPITYSKDFSSLLHGMLDKNPTTRWTLNAVADHPWTNQNFDLRNYTFEDIVICKPSELYPPMYISEVIEHDETMSTTSSSFVYEDHQSINKSGTKDRSSSSPLELRSLNNSYVEDPNEISSTSKSSRSAVESQVDLISSRTSTSHSTTSLQSSVTIDSSILIMSPIAKNFKRARMPSESSESTNEISSRSNSSNMSDSTNSLNITFSSNSSRSKYGNYLSYTDNGSSISPASSRFVDSLIRERTISVSSSTSEEDTLNSNFNALLTTDDKQGSPVINSFCGSNEKGVCSNDLLIENENCSVASNSHKTLKCRKILTKFEYDSKVPYKLFDEYSNSFSSCSEIGNHSLLHNDSISLYNSSNGGLLQNDKTVSICQESCLINPIPVPKLDIPCITDPDLSILSVEKKIDVSDTTKDTFYTADELYFGH